jgi:hypothetical protein
MTHYECKICSFITNHRTNYKKHLLTDKHNRKEREIEKIQERKNIETICKYCDKKFSCKQSMYYHIKYNCKKNNDEDIKELVRLLNKERSERKEDKEQIANLQKQIDKLSGKLEININTTNIQNNFILSYNETDTSHLTDKDYESAINKVNNSIKYLIEKIHFNPEKPENMNIFIPNLKNKYLMLFENGSWQTKSRKDEIDFLKSTKEDLINEWFEANKNNYPKLKTLFERYINNADENNSDNCINDINKTIELALYNNKHLIKNV